VAGSVVNAATTIDLSDVQGLLKSGYASLGFARYLMYTLPPGPGGAQFLSALLPSVTRADQRSATAVTQLAVTASGLAALGLAEDELELFSQEFVAGMTTPARSSFLGDVGNQAPVGWSWGGPNNARVDVLVICLAASAARLDADTAAVEQYAQAAGLIGAARLDTQEFSEIEPFGFRDGISQPVVPELSSRAQVPAPAPAAVELGEFALGYRNAYGQITDRPMLPPASDPDGLLPTAAGLPGHPDNTADLGRNGSYLVLRTLAQDVAGFSRYLDQAASSTGTDATALAAKFVGRWPGGAPLALSPDSDRPELATANDFGYADADQAGYHCPLGAHIRRVNPRDFLDGELRDVSVTNRHRLLRRGRKYRAVADSPAEAEVGLHFIALNANLSRQFEFVQHSWINDPKFNGLYEDIDAIVGARSDGASSFTVQAQPVRTRYEKLPSFVTVRGGAYFFLPGLRALNFLAAQSGERADFPRSGS
jgi:Dyp-type peroxidase family